MLSINLRLPLIIVRSQDSGVRDQPGPNILLKKFNPLRCGNRISISVPRTNVPRENHMACAGLSEEDYHLWPLGLLEGSKTECIGTHIAEQCADCVEDVWEGLDLWALYATAASYDPAVAPSAEIRARLLDTIRRSGSPSDRQDSGV